MPPQLPRSASSQKRQKDGRREDEGVEHVEDSAHAVRDLNRGRILDSDPALAATYRYVIRRITDSDEYIKPVEFNARARAAGAYVPVEPNALEVDMNGGFLSVHALRDGTFDFKLPFPCKVRNVKSGQFEDVSGGTFKITVEAGQTCWFTL